MTKITKQGWAVFPPEHYKAEEEVSFKRILSSVSNSENDAWLNYWTFIQSYHEIDEFRARSQQVGYKAKPCTITVEVNEES